MSGASLGAPELRLDRHDLDDLLQGLGAAIVLLTSEGVIAYASPALRSTLYNVSSGCAWSNPIAEWCEALRRAFPRFQYRTAEANETANIWFTDRDRGLMDIGRLARDLDFRPKFLMGEAYSDFIDWLARGPSA